MRNALIVLPYVSALPLVVLGVLVMALWTHVTCFSSMDRMSHALPLSSR